LLSPWFDSRDAPTDFTNQEKSAMQFELTRTTAKFGVFNPREEKNKGNAFDLPFSVTLSSSILAMLAPTTDVDGDDEDFANTLFSDEGHVSRPSINPIHINRKPEGAIVKIWDQEDFGTALELKPCNLKSLKAELQTPNQVVLTGMIQYSQYSDAELIRINGLMNKSFDLEIVIEQSDLFEDPEGESEGEDKDPK
jgi:hypothetical protein